MHNKKSIVYIKFLFKTSYLQQFLVYLSTVTVITDTVIRKKELKCF